MFILKRQDVEIKNFQLPSKEKPIPVLHYQGQTFRLLSMFSAAQEEEARALWRDLTDNRGKACVLLEEPERFSVWGKVRLDAFEEDGASSGGGGGADLPLIQGCLLLLQALFIDIEDLLGQKQADLFEKDIAGILIQSQFPQATSDNAIKALFTMDPLATQVPPWDETHLVQLLQAVHRFGKDYFGNTTFTERAVDALEDLPDSDRQKFLAWLDGSPAGKLWK